MRAFGNGNRIIAAAWLCPEDFSSREVFYEKLVEVRKRLALKHGPEHILDIGGVGFLDTVGSWGDELTVGGFDQPELTSGQSSDS